MAEDKLRQLEHRLKQIGCNFRFWGKAELRELANVLFPGEVVEHCVNGSYEGGFALLVATDQRVLLIDKKPFYLTLEDLRFDMITEVDYNHRLLNATVFICTPNKSMRFLGYNRDRLRLLFHFVQTRVMEIRQHYQHQGQIWKEYAQSLQPGQPAPQQQYGNQTTPELPAAAIVAPPDPATLAQSQPQLSTTLPPSPPPMPAHQTIAPVISAYTRLPLMSRQRRFLGSRAINTPMPSIYQ